MVKVPEDVWHVPKLDKSSISHMALDSKGFKYLGGHRKISVSKDSISFPCVVHLSPTCVHHHRKKNKEESLPPVDEGNQPRKSCCCVRFCAFYLHSTGIIAEN